MSRIVLSRYPDGHEHVVVGWDHPCRGAFWQEFNEEPDMGDDDWQEVVRSGGMFPGIPLNEFEEDVPEDLRPLVTPRVMEQLTRHSIDPDSGVIYHDAY